jgi:hypothetical protein
MGSLEYEKITFTREEFYEAMWNKPATKIVAELGCSDVTIAKVCKAFKIPKPPVGYWAKLQYGKKIKKVSLPQCDDPQIQSLVFRKYPKEDKPDESESISEFDQDIIQILEKAKELPFLQVPDTPTHGVGHGRR